MKSKYKYFASAALSGLFGLLVAFSASAQHRGGGGGGGSHGGGGGFHGGGGGGSHFSGGGGFSRGGGGASFNRGGSRQAAPNALHVNSSQGYRGNVRSYSGGGRGAVYSRGNVNSYRGGAYNRGGAYRGGAYNRGGYRGGYYNRGGYYGRGGYNRFYGHYAFYNRFYLPRLGFSLSVLPFGYYPFYWGDEQYYYSDGYYYNYNNDNYTVVEPPVGAILNQVPSGAKSIMIDGQQYYELNGVYYQAVTKDDGTTGYQIAGKDGELSTGASTNQDDPNGQVNNQPMPKIGDVIDSLPADCNTVKIDGQKYYVSPDGIYYQEDKSNGRKVYRVAGTPDDQPGE
jgi:hypothetical protein